MGRTFGHSLLNLLLVRATFSEFIAVSNLQTLILNRAIDFLSRIKERHFTVPSKLRMLTIQSASYAHTKSNAMRKT